MCKVSWITFSFEKSFWIVLGYWAFELVYRLILYLEWDYFQLTEDAADNEYLYIGLLVFSDLFSFFELFRYEKEEICNIFKLIDPCNSNEWKYLLVFIGITCVDLISRSTFYISQKLMDVDNKLVSQKLSRDSINLIDILFRLLFFILFQINDSYTYRHKVFSILSFLFLLTVLVIIDIIHLYVVDKYDILNSFKYFATLLIRSVFYPLLDTIINKLLLEKKISPIGYIRRKSIIEIILFIIITLILLKTSVLLQFYIFLGIFLLQRNFLLLDFYM